MDEHACANRLGLRPAVEPADPAAIHRSPDTTIREGSTGGGRLDDRGECPRRLRTQATSGPTGTTGRWCPRRTAPDDDRDADSGPSRHGPDPRYRAPASRG